MPRRRAIGASLNFSLEHPAPSLFGRTDVRPPANNSGARLQFVTLGWRFCGSSAADMLAFVKESRGRIFVAKAWATSICCRPGETQ